MRFIKALYLLGAATVATPLAVKRFAAVDTKILGTSFDETAVGSIYFVTNDPTGSYVISASINGSGLITPSYAVSTLGTGSHGIGIPSAPGDPLFSQGPVAVEQNNGLVAAVNAGSNTVQLFSIDPLIPSILEPLGPPVPSAGQFPISAAFNNAGDMLCVISGGIGASVRCYSVNEMTGLTIGSTRSLSLNTTTPPTGIPDSVSTVGFTPDDSTVLAVVKGRAGSASDPSVFYSWEVVSTQTAALSASTTRTPVSSDGAQPFSITFVPGQKAFFSADSKHGVDVFDFSQGLGGPIKTNTFTIANQSASCWSTYSPKSGNYYVADLSNNYITEISLNSNLTPSFVNRYPSPVPGGVNEMAVGTIHGIDYLFTLLPSPNSTSVGVLRINGPASASWVQTVDFATPAAAANLSLRFTHVVGMGLFLK